MGLLFSRDKHPDEGQAVNRRAFLLLGVCALLAGCSSSRYRYEPVHYDGSLGSRVLQTAMTQYGAKYRYGKASPSEGFDCSGLIFWAYGKHGIVVPRHTSLQAKAGKWVSAKNARQGDIVVFRIGRQLHTGLLADRGRFLHAPSSGGYVRMELLNNTYWKKKIIGYRRIV